MRKNLNSGTIVILLFGLFLTLFIFLSIFEKPIAQAVRRGPAPNFSDMTKVSSRSEFFDLCGKKADDLVRFVACRQRLSVLSTSFIWVDREFLVRGGELVSREDFDALYGLSGRGAESARLTINSTLLARCRRGVATKPVAFEELIDPDCLRRLPTLAELGLEMDSSWAGVRMVDSTYDGKMKPILTREFSNQ